jgi:tetratricopeptide (TPR) repeat protein
MVTTTSIYGSDVPRAKRAARAETIKDQLWILVSGPDKSDATAPGKPAAALALNEVASRIWQLCDGRNVDQIAATIVTEYEVDAQTALIDVKQLLHDLRQMGALELIRPRDKGASDAQVVFRDAKGRTITWDELKQVDGRFRWEVRGAGTVDPRAQELHAEGRNAGAIQQFDRALHCFAMASELEPDWPYPVYDTAFTYLMMGDTRAAQLAYQRVDGMAPRGFFTAKTTLHTLAQEQSGALPPGFTRLFATLEWITAPTQKRSLLEQIVARHPGFAPAWKELSMLLDSEHERLRALERGLALDTDGETRGVLLINKAFVLARQGDKQAAVEILAELVLDPASTQGTEALAKAALAQVVSGGQADLDWI